MIAEFESLSLGTAACRAAALSPCHPAWGVSPADDDVVDEDAPEDDEDEDDDEVVDEDDDEDDDDDEEEVEDE